MSTVFFTLSLSLFDSLSTAQQIVIFALLLTTQKPIRNSLSFLFGLSFSYFVCGIVGFLTIDQLVVFIGKYFPSTANMTNAHYYLWEFFLGMAMTVFGIWYYRKKRHAPLSHSENMLIVKLKSMNSLFALGIGVFISVSSFPFSIPYIVALGKYSAMHQNFIQALGNILLYNIGYALPMVVVFIIYLIVRKGSDNLSGTLQEKSRVLNIQLTAWTMVCVGIFSMIDAGFYFTIGQALVNGRFF